MKRKVNLFVIGASKCGTTSIYHILNEHTNIYMSDVKETNYFAIKNNGNIDYSDYFSEIEDEKVIGEVSPIYSELHVVPWVPRRIYKYNRHSKILYLVRNPIKRIESVWKQTLSTGHWRENIYLKRFGIDVPKMSLKFEKAVFNYPPFIETCKYWKQIEGYRKYFDDDQIKVIIFEDFVNYPQETVDEICDFLNVEKMDITKMNLHHNPSKNKTMINPKYSKLFYLAEKSGNFITKVIPKFLKLKLKEKIIKKVPEEIHINKKLKKRILLELENDIKMILKYAKKDTNYWTFK